MEKATILRAHSATWNVQPVCSIQNTAHGPIVEATLKPPIRVHTYHNKTFWPSISLHAIPVRKYFPRFKGDIPESSIFLARASQFPK
jgi:hypothetical protein